MAADIKAKNWIDRFDSDRMLSERRRQSKKKRNCSPNLENIELITVSNPAVPKCHFERLPSVVNTTIERTIRLLNFSRRNLNHIAGRFVNASHTVT